MRLYSIAARVCLWLDVASILRLHSDAPKNIETVQMEHSYLIPICSETAQPEQNMRQMKRTQANSKQQTANTANTTPIQRRA